MTDKGFEHAVMAQQVFGGHGYIEEHGMSQFVRDARIAMIYEGANGIQALDLVGRKLGLNGGRAVQAFFKEVGEFCEENRADEKMAPYTKALKKGLNDLQAATMWLMQNAMAEARQCGCGLDRFHAPLRPRLARLHVGDDGEKRAGQGSPAAPTDRHRSTRTSLSPGVISWSV